MILRIIGIFIGILALAVMLETPRKYVLTAGFIGGVTGFIYLICEHYGNNVVLASFFSALAAAIVSHIFARIQKAPVTLFLIAGILPTVPGGGMYRIVANAIDGNQTATMNSLLETLEIAGAIALAIFFVDAMFRFQNKKTKHAHDHLK